MKAVALTIAGSDPSGGAGIQADLKTFHQFGVYGEAVLSLLTVQNTTVVERVVCLAPELILAQLNAVLSDIPPLAAKTGALGNEEIVAAIADAAAGFDFPLVVDPVMISKHGAPLISEEAGVLLARRLLPHATLVTPNIPEAAALSGLEITDVDGMRKAAERIVGLGPHSVLVKGGHLAGPALDLLWFNGDFFEYPAARIDTPHTHGTGCTYSAAITAEIALGSPIPFAVQRAKNYVTAAIRTNPGLGHGSGPVNHHAPVEDGAHDV